MSAGSYVLLVEDDDALRSLMAHEIAREYPVIQASTCADAMLRLERWGEPLAAVCDYNLGPGGWGDRILALVAELYPDAARLLVSAGAPAEVGGAPHVRLGKPWNRGELLTALDRAILCVAAGCRPGL